MTCDCLWLLSLELRAQGLEAFCFVLTEIGVSGMLKAGRFANGSPKHGLSGYSFPHLIQMPK